MTLRKLITTTAILATSCIYLSTSASAGECTDPPPAPGEICTSETRVQRQNLINQIIIDLFGDPNVYVNQYVPPQPPIDDDNPYPPSCFAIVVTPGGGFINIGSMNQAQRGTMIDFISAIRNAQSNGLGPISIQIPTNSGGDITVNLEDIINASAGVSYGTGDIAADGHNGVFDPGSMPATVTISSHIPAGSFGTIFHEMLHVFAHQNSDITDAVPNPNSEFATDLPWMHDNFTQQLQKNIIAAMHKDNSGAEECGT